MYKMNRRKWNKIALSGLAALALPQLIKANLFPDDGYKGVTIGLQSYSLRDRSLEDALKAMKQLGIGSCELWPGHVEPRELSAEQLSAWRKTAPLHHFTNTRDLFDKHGITISAYGAGFRNYMQDDEMEKIFSMTKALGVNTITSSATVDVTPRVDHFAQRYKIKVGLHNHDKYEDKNELSNEDSFERALKGRSEYMAINLDTGHLVAANGDPIDFIHKYHSRIVTLHIKDRKKQHGANVPFGTGDTPIREILQLMKRNKYDFPANIEYEYRGQDAVEEIEKCLKYCRETIA